MDIAHSSIINIEVTTPVILGGATNEVAYVNFSVEYILS